MKELTVKQLAAISGVTVRTLHHYDEIGLLAPARVGANGYRYYGRHELLRLQRTQRYRTLIDTIDRTVAELQGEASVANEDLYKGFSAGKQAGYEAWLTERYGEPLRADIEHSRRKHGALSDAERASLMKELKDVEQALAEGMRRGIHVDAEPVDRLLARHRAWVATMWDKPCVPAAYSGLAELYLSHADFRARYEAIAPGFAQWLTTAMKSYATRHATS